MIYINITNFVLISLFEKDYGIIETRRLKSAVFFIQAILSFVLSRKFSFQYCTFTYSDFTICSLTYFHFKLFVHVNEAENKLTRFFISTVFFKVSASACFSNLSIILCLQST